MQSRRHSHNNHFSPIDPLPLCANEDYYRQLDPCYPRNEILRKVRWVLSHFVLDALGILGLIYVLAQDLVTNLVSVGPDILNLEHLKRWFAWQLIVRYPFVCGLAIVLFLLLIPIGLWMRRDEQREKEALERQLQGLRLAQAYRAYLVHLVRKTGALPRLLQYDQQTLKSHDSMIFAPLRLAQTKLTTVQRTPLDEDGKSSEEREGNPGDRRKIADILEIQSPPGPALVVSRATDALALAHSGAIVVLGQPGSGKTTLLRHLVWEQAQAQLNATKPAGRVPIFLDLAMPDVATRDLRTSIKAEVEGAARVDEIVSSHIIDTILQGPSLIVVDGLDELLGNIRKSVRERLEILVHTVTASMEKGSSSYVPVQVAVSSRVSSFRKGDLNLQKFETWELLPLTNLESQRQLVAQILELLSTSIVSTRMQLDPDRLLMSLEEQPQTAGWATNPLLLTLATLDWVHNRGNRLARTRVALYSNAIEELLKQRMKDWSFQELTEVVWLAEDTALELFQQGQRSLTMQDFSERIIHQLPPRLTHRIWGPEKLGAGDVLLSWSGLFVLDSNGRYDIYHLTFLEFLAARALARQLAKEWSAVPVSPTAFLAKFETQSLLENDLHREMKVPKREVLARLWLKRTATRWSQVLMMMTGVLSEEVAADRLVSNLNRSDLAHAWIRALLDQPDDIGLLGLRLAAGCAAEMGSTSWHTQTLVSEITDRLVTQLCKASTEDRETLKQALQRASTMLASAEIGQEAICDSLVACLIDPDRRVRKVAAETIGLLGVAGKAAFPKLIAQLADSDPQVRKAVAEAISMLGAAGVDILRHLVPHLNNPDPDVRVAVVQAIGKLGQDGASALHDLCAMLVNSNEHADVCQSVVDALGNMGLAGAPALKVLYARLADSNVNIAVRVAIVEAISSIGIAGVDVLQNLLAHLTDSDWRVRAKVVYTIGKLGSTGATALDSICAKLADKNENTAVRQSVAWAIGTLGPLASQTLDALRDCLEYESRNVAVRQAVVWAIGTLGLDGAPALDTLSAILSNENENLDVRREAAEAIAKIGTAEIFVLSHLVPHLTDSESKVRVAVSKAIGALGHAGVPALEILADKLADENENVIVRQAIAEAIGKIGTAEVDALLYLVPHLSDPNPDLRVAVVQAIGTLELDSIPALPNLCALLKDPDAGVREAVALVLGRLGREAGSALPALIEQLNDHDEDVRVAVEWAIRGVGATDIPVNYALLADFTCPNWQVKRAAAGIVKAFGLKAVAVLPQLRVQLAKPDNSAVVREKIAQAVGALGAAVGSSIPSLVTWLSDPEWRVREAMRRSLRELGEAGVPIVEHLSQLVTDPGMSASVRVAVIEAIRALASEQQLLLTELHKLLPTLYELLANAEDWHVQQAVEETLRTLQMAFEVSTVSEMNFQLKGFSSPALHAEGKITDIADLAPQLRDIDLTLRTSALQTIIAQKPPIELTAPLLLEALSDAEPVVSDLAAATLSNCYPSVLTARLLEDLSLALEGYPEGVFQPFAQRNELDLYLTLGAASHPFLDRILALLQANHWSVREKAVNVLGALRHNSYTTVSTLLRLYKEDDSPAVRKAADEALTAILSLDDPFGEGISEILEYQNW